MVPQRSSLVGLTTTLAVKAGPHGQPQVQVYKAYLAALLQVGLVPVLITPAHPPEAVAALLANCSGLVLSGGGDVDPARFDEAPRPEVSSVSAARDAMEFAALEVALARGLPVLGICRGIQVINVFLGGTLYQDIAAQLPDSLRHDQSEPWDQSSHELRVEPDCRLTSVFYGQTPRVNSFHHQSVRDPAPSLAVVAVSPDGVIEGVESRTHPWVVGVQWHPERHPADTPATAPDRKLLTAFAGAVAEYRESPR